jgi:hypothetical protein
VSIGDGADERSLGGVVSLFRRFRHWQLLFAFQEGSSMVLGEQGVGRRTFALVLAGISTILLSVFLVGFGNSFSAS